MDFGHLVTELFVRHIVLFGDFTHLGRYTNAEHVISIAQSAGQVDHALDVRAVEYADCHSGLILIVTHCCGYGELIVKGDLIFKGYMNDEAATKAAFTPDGYFLTGDIGTIRNNKVYVRCRKDKLITLPNGENVSPKRIEEKIRSIRTDITAAKIYIRDDKLNADIYVQDPAVYDDPEVRKSLIDELNGSISKFERIDKCNIISSLQMMK